eukprot:3816248-Alexandrium_andersonii.AAC.1
MTRPAAISRRKAEPARLRARQGEGTEPEQIVRAPSVWRLMHKARLGRDNFGGFKTLSIVTVRRAGGPVRSMGGPYGGRASNQGPPRGLFNCSLYSQRSIAKRAGTPQESCQNGVLNEAVVVG